MVGTLRFTWGMERPLHLSNRSTKKRRSYPGNGAYILINIHAADERGRQLRRPL
jgi:hypothetical protein